ARRRVSRRLDPPANARCSARAVAAPAGRTHRRASCRPGAARHQCREVRPATVARSRAQWRRGAAARVGHDARLRFDAIRQSRQQRIMTSAMTTRLHDYYELTKPRVVSLIAFTAIVGMLLAVPGMVPLGGF